MQVLVQSYRRLKYLKQTVDSLRLDDVDLFIVDGGSDQPTKDYIKSVADKYLFFNDNPGSDFLKNEGIKHLITDNYFILSADDIEYSEGYSKLMKQQFEKLNWCELKWAFCSSNMEIVENQNLKWSTVNGVDIYQVSGLQSASAIVSRVALMQVGLYPVYGKYGAGDWALGKMLLKSNYHCCYIRQPMVIHLGNNNAVDYPEFQNQANIDINTNYKKAIHHGDNLH